MNMPLQAVSSSRVSVPCPEPQWLIAGTAGCPSHRVGNPLTRHPVGGWVRRSHFTLMAHAGLNVGVNPSVARVHQGTDWFQEAIPENMCSRIQKS